MPTDPELLELIEKSPEKGFRLLVSTYSQPVYYHVRRMVYSHDDANDITQETFIQVFKHLPKFQGKSKLFSWIYRIATNQALNFIKQKARKQNVSWEEVGEQMASSLEGDSYFDADDATLKLETAVAKLPEKQKLVFQMKYFEELTYEQISEILDTSVGALKASYHHAVKKIEHLLKHAESN